MNAANVFASKDLRKAASRAGVIRLVVVAVVASFLGLGVVSAYASAPSNDNFANATVLTDADLVNSTPGVPTQITGTTAGATSESGDPVDLGGHSVWFKWTAGTSGTMRFYGDFPYPRFDTFVLNPSGTTVSDLNEVGPSGRTMNIHAGTTYYFGVGDSIYANAPGAFTVNVYFPDVPDQPQLDSAPNYETLSQDAAFTFSTPYESGLTYQCRLDAADVSVEGSPAYGACTSGKSYSSLPLGLHKFQVRSVDAGGAVSYANEYDWYVLAVPSNDDLANAQVLDGDSGDTTGDMLGATTETDEQVNSGVTRTVWYAWTPSQNGSAHLTGCCYLTGRVYTSDVDHPTSVGQLTMVDDNNPDLVVTGGTTYYWQIEDGFGADSGNGYHLYWSLDNALVQPYISDGPTNPTLDHSASFTFASSELGVSYQCRLDPADPNDYTTDTSVGWQSCTSPKGYSGLGLGGHVFQVRAVDAYDDVSVPYEADWSVQDGPDNDAFVNRTVISPDTGQIDGSTLGASVETDEDAPLGQQSVWYEWTPSTSGTAHLTNNWGYVVAAAFTSTADTPTLADLTLYARGTDFAVEANKTYYIQVENYYDGFSGNFTLYWDDNTTVDSPYFTSDGYPDNPTLQHTATFKWDDSEVGVHYKCRLDGADSDPFTSCTSPLTVPASGTLAAGSHTFEVEALDTGNNVSVPATYTWTIASAPGNDNFADRVTVSGDSGSVGGSLFGATSETGEPSALGDHTVWYQWTAGSSGTAHFNAPGASTVELFTAGATPTVSTLTSYGADNYDYSVTQGTTYYIGVGNSIYGANDFTLNWLLDNNVTQPYFTAGPATSTRHTDAQFGWSDTEAHVSYLCRLDLGGFDTCPADGQLSELGVGSHTFQVEAVDAAGNTSNAAQYTWQVLDPLAIPTIFNKPADPTTATTATFGISDDSTGVSFQCRLDSTSADDPFNACLNGVTYQDLLPGSHTFEVRATDADGDYSQVQSYTWQILAPTGTSTTALTSDANPSVFGQQVTLTATVTPSGGTSSGSVDFTEGGVSLGTATVSAGKATLQISTLGVGGHSLTATYTPDGAAGVSGSSGGLSQTVNQASTTTTLGTSVSPSKFGQTVSITATVAPVSPGAGTPSGSVSFSDATGTLGTVSLTNGKAILTTHDLSVGTHQLSASYGGDTSFLTSSTATALSQVVQKASTTTGLVSSVTPSVFGQSVTFTATVLPVIPGSGTRTGTVTFSEGGTSLGTGTVGVNGVATFSTSSLSVGDHPVVATYNGDGNFTSSSSDPVTQTVHKGSTTTTLGSATNPSVYGQSVQLTATVVPVSPSAGTPGGTVTFSENGTDLATRNLDSSGHAVFSSSTFSVGGHSITATYNGDGNFETSSTVSALSQQVNKGDTSTAITSSVNPSVFGQAVTFTATVSVTSPAAGQPSGSVTFTDGSNSLGSATVNPATGMASLTTTSPLAVGAHSVDASYGGDGNFNGSHKALNQQVNKAGTTTTLSSDINPSTLGQQVTLTAHVNVTTPGAGAPSGTVTFKEGTTTLGTGTVTSGVATLQTSALTGGSHSLTAVYGGDASFLTSTSAALSQLVNTKASSTALSCTPVAGTRKTAYTCTATVTPTSPMPTGTVSFTAAKTVVTATLSGGTATGSFLHLRPATYAVTATYKGDSNYSSSVSAPVTITVAKK